MKSIFIKLLAAELLAAMVAPIAFSVITSRAIAGSVAGTGFFAIGIAILLLAKNRIDFRKAMSFRIGVVHFVLTIIIISARLTNIGTEFKDIVFIGMPGPILHQVSTYVFFVMMLGTAFDLYRSKEAVSA